MAVCVDCGLYITEAGKLDVKLDPAGGITCGANGLSVASAIATSDDAAMVCCNEAKAQASTAQTTANTANTTANTANGKADTALDRVPNRVRWGFFGGGTTNASGDIAFAHGLGADPAIVLLQPAASVINLPWRLVVENTDTTNVNVRVHDTTTGNAMGSYGVGGFMWFVAQ